METQGITRRQLSAVAFVAALTPSTRLLPGYCAAVSGRAAWLCPLAALPGALLIAACVCAVMRRRSQGEGLAAVALKLLGRPLGGALLAAYSLWLVFYAAFSLRSASSRFTVAIYPGTAPWPFIAVGAAMSLAAALGKVRALGRSAEIFKALLVLALALILAMGFAQLDAGALAPVTAEDALPVLRGAPPAMGILGLLLVNTAFIESDAPLRPGRWAASARWCALMALLCSLIVAVTLGSFGAELTAHFDLPFFTFVKNISVSGIAERLEALITAFWVFSDFVMCSLALTAASGALRLAFALPERPEGEGLFSRGRWLTWLCAAAAALTASLMAPTDFALALYSERIVPALNLAMMALLLVPLTLAALLRGPAPPARSR